MKYYAYLKQKGEGCDYTIGCAQTIITMNSLQMKKTSVNDDGTENWSIGKLPGK